MTTKCSLVVVVGYMYSVLFTVISLDVRVHVRKDKVMNLKIQSKLQ